MSNEEKTVVHVEKFGLTEIIVTSAPGVLHLTVESKAYPDDHGFIIHRYTTGLIPKDRNWFRDEMIRTAKKIQAVLEFHAFSEGRPFNEFATLRDWADDQLSYEWGQFNGER